MKLPPHNRHPEVSQAPRCFAWHLCETQEGERDPAKLAALRDRRCKKTEEEIAGHLTGTWRDEHLFNLGQAFKTLQFLDERIAEYGLKVSQMFASLAAATPAAPDASGNRPPPPLPPEKKLTARVLAAIKEASSIFTFMGFNLLGIPGIGYTTAAVIASELGSNFDRFPDEHHFASYIGLAPSLGKSAGKNVRQKKRCKNTSRVGKALRMAASTLYRSRTGLGAYLQNVARHSDKKTAIKATARRMAHMIYRGVRYGIEFIDRGAKEYEERLRAKKVYAANMLIKAFDIQISELTATPEGIAALAALTAAVGFIQRDPHLIRECFKVATFNDCMTQTPNPQLLYPLLFSLLRHCCPNKKKHGKQRKE